MRTSTVSRTHTITRIRALVLQVSMAIKKTSGRNDNEISKVIEIGLATQWINDFHVYGLAKNGQAIIRFTLSIDWVQHSTTITTSGSDLTVPSVWSEDIATEVEAFANMASDVIEAHDLSTQVWVTINPKFDATMVRQNLGLSPQRAPAFEGTTVPVASQVRRLDELKLNMEVVDGY